MKNKINSSSASHSRNNHPQHQRLRARLRRRAQQPTHHRPARPNRWRIQRRGLVHPQPHRRHRLSRLQLQQVLHRRRRDPTRQRHPESPEHLRHRPRISSLPSLELIADIPVYDGTRNQVYPPTGIFQVSGLGDVTIGAQSWIFRPPTENGGNIAVSASLKIPTGINNATGSALYKGQTIKATADPSLQPGDGGWGFVVGTQGYKSLWRHSDLYVQGLYLFNPKNTNGVPSFRSQPGQSIMSVTDQYLFRTGISQSMPKVRGLAFSFGVRAEGVPVRDLIGSSDGFRRPGSIISLDPGVMYNFRQTVLSVNGPWAIYRDRPPSVPEIQKNAPKTATPSSPTTPSSSCSRITSSLQTTAPPIGSLTARTQRKPGCRFAVSARSSPKLLRPPSVNLRPDLMYPCPNKTVLSITVP